MAHCALVYAYANLYDDVNVCALRVLYVSRCMCVCVWHVFIYNLYLCMYVCMACESSIFIFRTLTPICRLKLSLLKFKRFWQCENKYTQMDRPHIERGLGWKSSSTLTLNIFLFASFCPIQISFLFLFLSLCLLSHKTISQFASQILLV